MKLQITIEGKKYDVEVEVAEEASAVPLAAAPRAASAPSGGLAPRASGGGADTRPVAGEKAVRSPLAGSVTEILVKVGDTVAADQAVLTLEAMKMLSTITSPVEGKIATVEVAVGDAVKPNQLLIALE